MHRLVIAVLIATGLSAFGGAEPEVSARPDLERPLIVAKDEGEVRAWRPLVSESPAEQKFDELSRFMETLPPGAGIPYHRHLHEDEVLYIVSGSAHVHVGSLNGMARSGAIVFIPRDTWVSLQPAGKLPISLFFAFNAPGFDNYMRCESAALGERSQPVTIEEDRRCAKKGDVQYR